MRNTQLLALVVSGLNQQEIAEMMGMSVQTTREKMVASFRSIGMLSSGPCNECGCMSLAYVNGESLCFRHLRARNLHKVLLL